MTASQQAPTDRPSPAGTVGEGDSRKAGFKPLSIRPLMVPVGVTVIPEPVAQFDRISLRKRVTFERRQEPTSVRGVLKIAYREIGGIKRPVAALSDGIGRKVWIAIEPTEDNHGAYIRLFELRGRRVTLLGRLYEKDKAWFIEDPEPIPARWVGNVRPIYDLHVRTLDSLVRHAPDSITASYLCDAKLQNEFRRSVADEDAFRRYLSASVRKLHVSALKDRECMYVALGVRTIREAAKSVRRALTRVHRPSSHAEYDEGMKAIQRMAAVSVIAEQVKEGLKKRRERLELAAAFESPTLPAWVASNPDEAVTHYSRHLPFTLTTVQRAAAAEILADLASGNPMRRVLSGDVGSGKTGVFAVAVAAMVDAGFRVGVILPSTLLANQLFEKMTSFVPDARATLIAGTESEPDLDASLWIGTVGVQYRADRGFDLCVVDEQQRFSVNQRQWQTADKDHLLEVTATCIPRTQALMDSAVLDISRLTSTHVEKRLHTRLWEPDERGRLIQHVRTDLSSSYKVMVVYPGKNANDSSAGVSHRIAAVAEFREVWERLFPGRVAVCHGGQSDEENEASVAALRAGDKSILLATSIIEVGIDIPGVSRMIVVQPDRFGLATLHQLRGRVAREGGEGWCELVLIDEISERARARLDFLCRTRDGFRLAEFDLSDRGGGDIHADGHKQSGQMPKSPFKGYDPSRQLVSEIASELAEVYQNGVPVEQC